MEAHQKNPRRPVPEEFKNPPKLGNFVILYWDLFWELSTERLIECGPIPGNKIIEYSEKFSIPYDDLHKIIREMDGVYMKHLQEERSKKMNSGKSGASEAGGTSTIENRIGRVKANNRQ